MAWWKNPRVKKLEDSITENTARMTLPDDAFEKAPFDEQNVERTGYSNYSYWKSTLRVFAQNKVAMALVILMVLIVIFTFIQPILPGNLGYDANTVTNDADTGLPMRNVAPNEQFILGTNAIGQDLWARLWSGTRTSLFIGMCVALIQAAIGIVMGVLWGYVRKLDFIMTELYNVLDNIPTTVILILISFILRPGIKTIIIGLTITGWISMARFIRNQIIIIRDREYNLASRCLGTGTAKIIAKNLLPYLVSVIMLFMALAIPGAIGSEVFITYIGLGLPAEIPSLGNLVNEGRTLMMSPNLRYQLIWPVVLVSIVTVSFYVIGNAFSDAADPKNHVS